jgi:exosortase
MGNRSSVKSLFQLIAGVSLIGLILGFYSPVLISLVSSLFVNDDYSFGLLLPLVSGYIIYQKWALIRQIPINPSWLGLIIIFLGFSLYLAGELITDLYTTRVSFVIVLSGVAYLLGGGKMLRVLAFPFFLLFFMIPLPNFVISQLNLPLQLLSSQLATDILHAIGIAAVRQGNVIELGVRQLQVVAACSGLRYILSLGALGIIFCYFYQRRAWKVAILLIAIVLGAIIANSLRIAAIAVFPIIQEGFWHYFSGWLIFIFLFGIVTGLFFTCRWCLGQDGKTFQIVKIRTMSTDNGSEDKSKWGQSMQE